MLKLKFIFPLFSCLFFWGCTSPTDQPLPKGDPRPGILFVSERDGNPDIFLIQQDGSGLTRLTDHPAVDDDPAWSPDGTQIAFRSRRDGSSDIYVMPSHGDTEIVNLVNDPTESFSDEFKPKWHPNGMIIALYTDRFQPPLGNCSGLRGVHHLGFITLDGSDSSLRHFDEFAGEQETLAWSPDGETLTFGSLCSGKHTQLYTWNRSTKEVASITDADFTATHPDYSPDGQQLAFSMVGEENAEIFIMELATGDFYNLTKNEAKDTHPSWSPDGKWIAFTSNRQGNDDIFVINVETGETQNITKSPGDDYLPDWSPVK